MTEAEWLACTDPQPMLELLRGKATGRKLRLFACACCRRLWRLIRDERCKHAIETAERLSDDWIVSEESEEALLAACDAFQEAEEHEIYDETIADIASLLLCPEVPDDQYPKPFDAHLVSNRTIDLAGSAASYAAGDDSEGEEFEKGLAIERAAHCGLLREIAGSPFSPPPIDPVWLTHTVTNLAETTYEERSLPSGELDPLRLSVLADALEDAGCTDADILDHCRSGGPHVRGCWVVDLLTGRE
jgi:hypothetical protein